MNNDFCDVTKSALWTVSSVKGGYEISSMFDGKKDTFWQSDALPPHFLCAQFSKRTYISKVSIFLSIQNDETYTPTEIAVHIGEDPSRLTCFLKEELGQLQGWIDINIETPTIFFKIEITKNHQGGRDSRIRLIKLWGSPRSSSVDSNLFFISPDVTKYLTIR